MWITFDDIFLTISLQTLKKYELKNESKIMKSQSFDTIAYYSWYQSNMKIAIFTDAFFPQINGVVTHILNTTEELAKLGHDVYLFVPKHSKKIPFTLHPRIKIRYLSGVPFVLYQDIKITLPLSLLILNAIRRIKPDVIHFHTPFTVGMNAVMTAKILRIPLVGTFHSYFFEEEYLKNLRLDKSNAAKSFGWNYANYFYRQSDTIIAPSNFTKNDLIKHKINKPIEVISNGICLRSFGKKDLTEYPHPLPKKYFIYVGRLSPEKSLDVLFQAFKEFSKKNNTIDLVIVGRGPSQEHLITLAKKLELQDRIHFMGPVENKQLMETSILKNAVAFVTTSKSETQGISILEAMSMGLPIIAVKARGVIELITNNGIGCRPDDVKGFAKAMYTIVQDTTLRKQFSQESLKHIQHHSLDETIKKLLNIYNSHIKTIQAD